MTFTFNTQQEHTMAAKGKTNGTMFPEWDVTKVWADMKMLEFADMKMPEFNVDAMVAAQQKNMEALNIANKTVVESWQGFAKQQAELWQAAVEDTGVFAQDVASTQEPTDQVAKQAAFAKSAFENSLSTAREAQEIAAKTTNKTVDIVSKRWAESLDEAVTFVGKATPKAV
jgi:phasin family protein